MKALGSALKTAKVPNVPGILAETLDCPAVGSAFWMEGGDEFFLSYDK
jgi:hypothetical protein